MLALTELAVSAPVAVGGAEAAAVSRRPSQDEAHLETAAQAHQPAHEPSLAIRWQVEAARSASGSGDGGAVSAFEAVSESTRGVVQEGAPGLAEGAGGLKTHSAVSVAEEEDGCNNSLL